jgi:hypothetical protein
MKKSLPWLVPRWGIPEVAATAPRRSSFMLPLALCFAALVVVLAARHCLSRAAPIWLTGNKGLGESYLHVGTCLLYASWILAIGSAECLGLARSRLAPSRLWAMAVVLGVFLYLNFAP